MRISDWSSDVCSSDLPHVARVEILPRLAVDPELNPQRVRIGNLVGGHDPGSDRCEAVVRLVEQTVREMIEPARHIDTRGVAATIGRSRLADDVISLFDDDRDQLRLTLEDARGYIWQNASIDEADSPIKTL